MTMPFCSLEVNMNKYVKKSERNNPVKKSLRLKKKKIADLNMVEQSTPCSICGSTGYCYCREASDS